jgi:class 3 adenylate cyclase
MEISDALTAIDLDSLTERNSKRTSAVAIYADLDGFTKYVQEAEDNGQIVSLVRRLHMIRHEFHAVIKQDYNGLVLQHQGDRVFAVVHLPAGDNNNKRCRKGLDAAIGIQSSMEHVLKQQIPDLKELHVAIGLDTGTALLTRLGKKGKREAICLGTGVTKAERLQLRSGGKETRISKAIYDTIADEVLQGEFTKSGEDVYVANGLTFPKLDDLQDESAARAGTLGATASKDNIEVATSASGQTKPWINSKPWRAE